MIPVNEIWVSVIVMDIGLFLWGISDENRYRHDTDKLKMDVSDIGQFSDMVSGYLVIEIGYDTGKVKMDICHSDGYRSILWWISDEDRNRHDIDKQKMDISDIERFKLVGYRTIWW